jgi:membrane-bound acyltransferase YfiQ involved in biofilm formation
VLSWLLRFLVVVLVVMVVAWVVFLLLAMFPAVPEPMRQVIILIIGVSLLIAAVRWLGWPPGGAP